MSETQVIQVKDNGSYFTRKNGVAHLVTKYMHHTLEQNIFPTLHLLHKYLH